MISLLIISQLQNTVNLNTYFDTVFITPQCYDYVVYIHTCMKVNMFCL